MYGLSEQSTKEDLPTVIKPSESPVIAKKMFYAGNSTNTSNILKNLNDSEKKSNSVTMNILKDFSENFQKPSNPKLQVQTNALKRRRQNSDEYFRDENKNQSKLSNLENRENQYDFDDQDSLLKSPVKTWNRNNSKTFVKGFVFNYYQNLNNFYGPTTLDIGFVKNGCHGNRISNLSI